MDSYRLALFRGGFSRTKSANGKKTGGFDRDKLEIFENLPCTETSALTGSGLFGKIKLTYRKIRIIIQPIDLLNEEKPP